MLIHLRPVVNLAHSMPGGYNDLIPNDVKELQQCLIDLFSRRQRNLWDKTGVRIAFYTRSITFLLVLAPSLIIIDRTLRTDAECEDEHRMRVIIPGTNSTSEFIRRGPTWALGVGIGCFAVTMALFTYLAYKLSLNARTRTKALATIMAHSSSLFPPYAWPRLFRVLRQNFELFLGRRCCRLCDDAKQNDGATRAQYRRTSTREWREFWWINFQVLVRL
jgi:hypothetical protein